VDDLDWDFTRVDKSLPPLRWIANLFGTIGGWAILRLHYADEDNRKIAAKIYGFIYDKTFPFYTKYGTYYRVNSQIDEDI
jgi:hypothetical protein